MCFGSCRVTCDNCKPKFVFCPVCGRKNLLVFKECKKCKTPITEEMKQAAIAEWKVKAAEREANGQGRFNATQQVIRPSSPVSQ